MLKFLKAFAKLLAKLLLGGKRPGEVFYLNGTDDLPAPLGPDAEAQAIEQLFSPDPKASQNARDTLISHNLRLVVYLARRYENTGVSTEDLVSIGVIGLIKAIATFKPDKKIKLATYASKCVENEILMFLRKTGSLKREISIDEPMNADPEGNELTLSDVLGTDGEEIHKNLVEEEERTLIRAALATLDERERTIVALRYGLNPAEREYTQKEVADKLHISQSYISRLEKRSLEKLKKKLSS